MIAFCNTKPTVEPHGDGFLLTVASGEGKVQIMLTRHAAVMLKARLESADARAAIKEMGAEVVSFRSAKAAKRRRKS